MVYIPILETLGALLHNESIAAEVCIAICVCMYYIQLLIDHIVTIRSTMGMQAQMSF